MVNYLVLLPITFFLLCVELNVGGGVTLGRVGYLITFFSVLLLPKRFYIEQSVVPGFFLVFFLLSFIYLIFHPANSSYDYLRPFNWLVFASLTLCWIGVFNNLSSEDKLLVDYQLIKISLFFLVVALLFLLYHKGVRILLAPAWEIRGVLNTLPGGVSRYFYGINIFLITAFFFSRNTSKRNFTILFSVIFLVYISGSRQFLIAWIFAFLILSLCYLKYIKSFFNRKNIFIAVTILAFFSLILSGENSSLQERYTQTLQVFDSNSSEENSTSERLSFIVAGFKSAQDNPEGRGPGGVQSIVGRPVHNSYAFLAIEYGILGVFLYLLLGIFLSVGFYKTKSKRNFSGFISVYFITPLFNDVVVMAVFWIVICYQISYLRSDINDTLYISK